MMTMFSHCQVCRDKLEHTALFCPKCGQSTCSWECYVKHMAQHSREPQPVPRGETRAGDSVVVDAVREPR